MIDPKKENIALFEHLLSFFGTILTIYFNNNTNIQFLAFMIMLQHLIKVIRIIVFGFELKGSPQWFCVFHSFLNHFTFNNVVVITSFIILNLYIAIKYPTFFAKYNKKSRPYVFLFSVIYTSILTTIALYEPIFIHYSEEEIAERHNCSSGYRYRLYQYIFGSTITCIEFVICSIYCTIYIIHKIIITPIVKMKNQIYKRTKISLSKWIVILFICSTTISLSIINAISDVKNALNTEKGILEEEKLETTYLVTASSGILIFILCVSPRQIKYKIGINVKETSNHCFEYGLSGELVSVIPKNFDTDEERIINDNDDNDYNDDSNDNNVQIYL